MKTTKKHERNVINYKSDKVFSYNLSRFFGPSATHYKMSTFLIFTQESISIRFLILRRAVFQIRYFAVAP